MTHYYRHQLVQFKNGNDRYWAFKKVWYNDHNKPYKLEDPHGQLNVGERSEALMGERIYAEDHEWEDAK